MQQRHGRRLVRRAQWLQLVSSRCLLIDAAAWLRATSAGVCILSIRSRGVVGPAARFRAVSAGFCDQSVRLDRNFSRGRQGARRLSGRAALDIPPHGCRFARRLCLARRPMQASAMLDIQK